MCGRREKEVPPQGNETAARWVQHKANGPVDRSVKGGMNYVDAEYFW